MRSSCQRTYLRSAPQRRQNLAEPQMVGRSHQ